ncbi:HAD family hydrolase [Prochlorothrix hollandica]|uniref:CbbY n=1 Tax=Prochlorothrix hollandica PCC 9006 = CALU 1027 TaxID=317619 RepID=A0A0M2PZS3_PROHO|nr:HAD family hydrolase [Prochlorothrix hollandica]KKJ00204.1 CbbY [Prochlorothrix hollandica PCC 9006 = CALU 1027]
MVPQALIFDVDGTLAETERDGHRVAFNQTFAAAGLSWHWSETLYGQLLEIPGGKERIAHYLDQYCPPQDPRLPPQADRPAWIAALHQDKTQRYGQIIRQGCLKPRPGVLRLIQEARSAGVRLAIATTSALPNALAVLETALAPDAPHWFEVIAAGDIVAAKKPDPAIYHYVLQQLQLSPQACLVIEDSAQGLQAATAAGLTTLITTNAYTQHQDFSAAQWVLSDLGEPQRPCTVIRGSLGDPPYVSLDRLWFS